MAVEGRLLTPNVVEGAIFPILSACRNLGDVYAAKATKVMGQLIAYGVVRIVHQIQIAIKPTSVVSADLVITLME